MKKLNIKSRKNIIGIMTVISLLAVVLLRVVWVRSNDWKSIAFYVAVLVLLVAYFVLTLILWRCPACGKYLGKLDLGIKSCKNCGEQFIEDDISPKHKKKIRQKR